MRLIFYNHFHNGDIHASRDFVNDIISKLNPTETLYYHVNSSTILKDINLKHVKDKYDSNELIMIKDDDIIINTWFHTQYGHRWYQCTLEALYFNFNIIYQRLNIKLEPIQFYIPSVDYGKFNISEIDNYFKDNDKKHIYISNGEIMSEQALPENMDKLIKTLSENKNYNIILSNDTDFKTDSVVLSKDIIKSNGRDDLNENSYISTKCDIIIGRESGPYFFSYVKDNAFSDKKQTWITSSYVNPFLGQHFLNKNKRMIRLYNFHENMENIKKLL